MVPRGGSPTPWQAQHYRAVSRDGSNGRNSGVPAPPNNALGRRFAMHLFFGAAAAAAIKRFSSLQATHNCSKFAHISYHHPSRRPADSVHKAAATCTTVIAVTPQVNLGLVVLCRMPVTMNEADPVSQQRGLCWKY